MAKKSKAKKKQESLVSNVANGHAERVQEAATTEDTNSEGPSTSIVDTKSEQTDVGSLDSVNEKTPGIDESVPAVIIEQQHAGALQELENHNELQQRNAELLNTDSVSNQEADAIEQQHPEVFDDPDRNTTLKTSDTVSIQESDALSTKHSDDLDTDYVLHDDEARHGLGTSVTRIDTDAMSTTLKAEPALPDAHDDLDESTSGLPTVITNGLATTPSTMIARVLEETKNSNAPSSEDFNNLTIDALRSDLLNAQAEKDALRGTLEDVKSLADRLTEEKNTVEIQYRSLFGKVTQMKTSLGARLKQDAEELVQNRAIIEDLEAQNSALTETVAHMQQNLVSQAENITKLSNTKAQADEDMASMVESISQLKKSLLVEQSLRATTEEHSMMRAAEWENLAIEEKSSRDLLRDRVHDLEEQLAAQNDAYENLRSIVSQDEQTVTKLKMNIIELQEAHQDELRNNTESLQRRIDELQHDQKANRERLDVLHTHNTNLEQDLEKLRPYEQEVKEKNLLIGKLRHEAIILNEHLTKALRLLKRGASNDAVDRQLLNNLLLSFFQLPRQDSKRFEVLKILSSVLAWDDIQKEQAGLLRPGTTSMAQMPLSPVAFRSPPMSPSVGRGSMSRRASGAVLQAADFIGPNRESMSDLWINFLQSEAAMNAADAADNA